MTAVSLAKKNDDSRKRKDREMQERYAKTQIIGL